MISAFNNSLNILHTKFEAEIELMPKLAGAVEKVNTPYVVICAEDDFILLDALAPCLEFLDSHRDYSVVRGYGKWIVPHDDTRRLYPSEVIWNGIVECVDSLADHPDYYRQDGSFTIELTPSQKEFRNPPLLYKIDPYYQRAVELDRAENRLKDHLNSYSTTFYSVHRCEELKKNLQSARTETKDVRFGELFPSCLSVIQGKMKNLDLLYMVREWSPVSTGTTSVTMFDLITGNDYGERYARFRSSLVKELALCASISEEDANRVINEAFLQYLGGLFQEKKGMGKSA